MTNDVFLSRVVELEKRAKRGGFEQGDRTKAVDELIEEYFAARREVPPSALLERLTDVILHDDLRDRAKRRRGDKPAIYTEKDLMEGHQRAVRKAFEHAETTLLASEVSYKRRDERGDGNEGFE